MSKVYIYEGEAERIGRWTREFEELETGGELLVQYLPSGAQVVHLATGPGPRARRSRASFYQDADYLRGVCGRAFELHALQHGGSWHSHHTMDLAEPSGGDSHTVVRALETLQLPTFLLVIGNLSDEQGRPHRRGTPNLRAYRYDRNRGEDYSPLTWSVLPGESPVRADRRLASWLPEPRLREADVRLAPLAGRGETAGPGRALRPGSWVNTTEGLAFVREAVERLSEIGPVRMFPTADGRLELRLEGRKGLWSIVCAHAAPAAATAVLITPPPELALRAFVFTRPLGRLVDDLVTMVVSGEDSCRHLQRAESSRSQLAGPKEERATAVPFASAVEERTHAPVAAPSDVLPAAAAPSVEGADARASTEATTWVADTSPACRNPSATEAPAIQATPVQATPVDRTPDGGEVAPILEARTSRAVEEPAATGSPDEGEVAPILEARTSEVSLPGAPAADGASSRGDARLVTRELDRAVDSTLVGEPESSALPAKRRSADDRVCGVAAPSVAPPPHGGRHRRPSAVRRSVPVAPRRHRIHGVTTMLENDRSRASLAVLALGIVGASFLACGDDDTKASTTSASSSTGAGSGGSGGSGGGDDGLTVTTDLGKTKGAVRNGAKEWRGLPYGLPPVKELRWAMTKPAEPWQGVHDASAFGHACPQEARFNLTEESLHEDCLTLNVSVPADIQADEKLPVLFWIHGGAFVGGSSSLYRLDRLATRGRMVVVSVNYRLGVFGFMPHAVLEVNGSSGNLGLADQREAMRWVQRNIAAFGGDPTRVTIAGESAGGGSVCAHLAAPELVEGLFDKAIIQSAACLAELNTPKDAEPTANAIIAKVGCTKADAAATLACMQSADLKALLKAEGEYVDAHPENLISFAPTPGDAASPNAVYPRAFKQAIADKKLANVPLLYGGTRHESRLYVGYFWQAAQAMKGPAIDKDTFTATWLTKLYPGMAPGGGTYAAKIAAEYVPSGGFAKPSDPPETLGVVMSDYALQFPINNCLYQHTAERIVGLPGAKPLYYSEFADEDAPVLGVGIAKPYPDFALGSVHSSELNDYFPNLDNTSKIAAPDLGAKSQALADQMVAYWAAFVKTGDPAVKELPAWPKYSGPTSALLLEPGNVHVYDTAKQHHCAFWTGLYPERLN